ncbi:MAG: hypothetical protein AAFZ91_08805 [Pseudomonadota bacterium]
MAGRLTAFVAGLAILTGGLPAEAQTADSIAGHWTFEARVDPSCSFGGTAFLEQVEDGAYVGELTARQSCDLLEEDYIVRQDCQASVIGNQVSVRCTIVEFVNGFESPFYYPDNFTLTIDTATRMYGALVSSGAARPAEWVRAAGGIS